MSNNKQSSSIDFFWNQLPEILPFTVGTETAVKLLEAFEQAKAMHKDETLKLYYAYEDYVLLEEGIIKTFGQFYNETFNNNEQQ